MTAIVRPPVSRKRRFHVDTGDIPVGKAAILKWWGGNLAFDLGNTEAKPSRPRKKIPSPLTSFAFVPASREPIEDVSSPALEAAAAKQRPCVGRDPRCVGNLTPASTLQSSPHPGYRLAAARTAVFVRLGQKGKLVHNANRKEQTDTHTHNVNTNIGGAPLEEHHITFFCVVAHHIQQSANRNCPATRTGKARPPIAACHGQAHTLSWILFPSSKLEDVL